MFASSQTTIESPGCNRFPASRRSNGCGVFVSRETLAVFINSCIFAGGSSPYDFANRCNASISLAASSFFFLATMPRMPNFGSFADCSSINSCTTSPLAAYRFEYNFVPLISPSFRICVCDFQVYCCNASWFCFIACASFCSCCPWAKDQEQSSVNRPATFNIVVLPLLGFIAFHVSIHKCEAI